MLQIISGKFFKSENRHSFNGKGILYSNYSWIAPIETCVATLEPVDNYREVSSHVLSYVNQIEKNGPDNRAGGIVRVGDAEILDQFQLLATFGLRAYFSPFRDEVSQICRKTSAGGTDIYVPSQFIKRFFQPGISGNQKEVTEFTTFVRKVIGLKREVYISVMSALKTFRDALLASNYNLDLSYSMLIYCLESLTQGYDNYTVNWEDYEQNQRTELNKIFSSIDPACVASIKTSLLNSSNLRLRRRFTSFILNNIEDSFFLEEAADIHIPLRKSHIERALNNAYVMRSKYVHQLIPILHQLRIPTVSSGDVFNWEREPYLTISGLLRLVLHVINNFVRKSELTEKEDYNWRKDLPGIVTMKLAPQYWVWKTEGFEPEDTAARFSGFLSQLCDSFSTNSALTDLRSLLEVFETKIPQAKQAHRITMLAMYWLYNSIIKADGKRPNCDKFLEGYSKELSSGSIEMMIVYTILSIELPWSLEECIRILNDFQEKRFWKGTIEIPVILEIALICSISNYALKEGKFDDRIALLKTAIFEACGHLTTQKLLLDTIDKHDALDISNILGIKKQDDKVE
jgi:hypothetical protein